MQVQDAIDELKDAEGDETIAKEVESGKESIKDADKMKQVCFFGLKLWLSICIRQ